MWGGTVCGVGRERRVVGLHRVSARHVCIDTGQQRGIGLHQVRGGAILDAGGSQLSIGLSPLSVRPVSRRDGHDGVHQVPDGSLHVSAVVSRQPVCVRAVRGGAVPRQHGGPRVHRLRCGAVLGRARSGRVCGVLDWVPSEPCRPRRVRDVWRGDVLATGGDGVHAMRGGGGGPRRQRLDSVSELRGRALRRRWLVLAPEQRHGRMHRLCGRLRGSRRSVDAVHGVCVRQVRGCGRHHVHGMPEGTVRQRHGHGVSLS